MGRDLIFCVALELSKLFFKPPAEVDIHLQYASFKFMDPQLKAHSALWEYFESNIFLKESDSLTVIINTIS